MKTRKRTVYEVQYKDLLEDKPKWVCYNRWTHVGAARKDRDSALVEEARCLWRVEKVTTTTTERRTTLKR